MFKVPEKYSLRCGNLGTSEKSGNNGLFYIPHQAIDKYFYRCIATDGHGWEHVSVSLIKADSKKEKDVPRCPTWFEMCFIRDLFWHEEACVLQYHPAKSEYVNTHEYCLHLWRPVGVEIPKPLKEMV